MSGANRVRRASMQNKHERMMLAAVAVSRRKLPVGAGAKLSQIVRAGRSNVHRKIKMNDTKFDMPYIQDPTVFRAVMFARKMIREDELPAGVAITRAADYYEVEPSHVAHYVGLAAQRIRERKARQFAGRR